jgi:uncharacterized cupredoxin-like copper-binding protein
VSIRRTAAALSTATLVALGALSALSAGPAGASAKATTVKAVESDFHIALSTKSFHTGKYVFVAENKGQTTHALTITGPGLKNATTPDINPGKSAKLTVTFKKGKYDVFCPIPGHKSLGMNVNLVISASGGSASAPASSSGGYGY